MTRAVAQRKDNRLGKKKEKKKKTKDKKLSRLFHQKEIRDLRYIARHLLRG